MTEFDRGYKLLFSHKEMVEDLLRGFVREEWVEAIDFTSLEKLDTHHITDKLKERINDLIWRVRFKDQWLYVCILLEFQSTVDEYQAVRMMVYVGLLYQDLIRTKKLSKDGKLPPVLPIVLYNGEPRWNAAKDVQDLVEHFPGSLTRYSPKMKYLLIDEGAYKSAELDSVKNAVSILFQLEKSPLKEITIELIVTLFRVLEDKPELQRDFAVFINRIYFHQRVDIRNIYREACDKEEVTNMLSKNVERFIAEWKAEGRAEGEAAGEAKGKAEGLRNVAKNLLAEGMEIHRISEITGLTDEEIQAIRESLAH